MNNIDWDAVLAEITEEYWLELSHEVKEGPVLIEAWQGRARRGEGTILQNSAPVRNDPLWPRVVPVLVWILLGGAIGIVSVLSTYGLLKLLGVL